MSLPELKNFKTEDECKNYFIDNYCNCEVKTHDGIVVKFYEDMFEHSFYTRTYKSWKAKKDHYSVERGERIDWIKYVLLDPTIIPRKGYDKAKGSHDNSRRVTFLTPENYVVVINIIKPKQGKFVTAYLVDNVDTANKLNAAPVWKP